MRFITPVLFAAAAAYVGWFNASHADRTLLFPFVDTIFPSTTGNAFLQGQKTVQILAVLAVLFAIRDGVDWFRRKTQRTPL